MTRKEGFKLISSSSLYGNLGLFIGAGMSMDILNTDWNKVALSWRELIYSCALEFEIDIKEDIQTEGLSYPEIATEVAKIIAERDSCEYKVAIKNLKEKIAELTSWYPNNEQRIEYGNILKEIDPNWIITTNYDLIIECLLTGKCLSLGPNDQLISPQNLIPVYHLHGLRTNPDSIIISQEDYISLFRPNQYRQQKLSLSIKESTTLIIGYGLGDVNVLTAVDWTKNVYIHQRINYPHEIIQLLYTEEPKFNPYRDRNGIVIIEFNNLKQILREIIINLNVEKEIDKTQMAEIEMLNEHFKNPDSNNVEAFIDDQILRLSLIEQINKYDVHLIFNFLELFAKCMEETWRRAEPKGAFEAYDQNLSILLDILENIHLTKIPPALLESVVYNLGEVSYYVGDSIGKSHAAKKTWDKRKGKIPSETLKEVSNIAGSKDYWDLIKLLDV